MMAITTRSSIRVNARRWINRMLNPPFDDALMRTRSMTKRSKTTKVTNGGSEAIVRRVE